MAGKKRSTNLAICIKEQKTKRNAYWGEVGHWRLMRIYKVVYMGGGGAIVYDDWTIKKNKPPIAISEREFKESFKLLN